MSSHLPSPYRAEHEVVAECLARLSGALDWPRAAAAARPWVAAVRENPAVLVPGKPLKEYPSQHEGRAR